jgi:GMP synthase (glutamine-hydrolysing)
MPQTIAVLDFGSQYTQVIARRIRECQVYSKIYHFSTPGGGAAQGRRRDRDHPLGGPSSVFAKNAPIPDKGDLRARRPGPRDLLRHPADGPPLGGKVAQGERREYGHGNLQILKSGKLFAGLPKKLRVWNSHGDKLMKLPPGFKAIGSTENSPYAVIEDQKRRFYAIQFHPEVFHTERGTTSCRNFLSGSAARRRTGRPRTSSSTRWRRSGRPSAKSRVILGLSGGVDSSVAAALIHKAIGRQLTCVFVDNGLLRKGEREAVESPLQAQLQDRPARRRRLGAVPAAPEGRRRSREEAQDHRADLHRGLREVAQEIGHADFLAQGTLYPDIIESVAIGDNPAALIKSHHNVGGLPARMKLKLLEPLKELFKDEVRPVGSALGLPREVVWRQPFPGPGSGSASSAPITPETSRSCARPTPSSRRR